MLGNGDSGQTAAPPASRAPSAGVSDCHSGRNWHSVIPAHVPSVPPTAEERLGHSLQSSKACSLSTTWTGV